MITHITNENIKDIKNEELRKDAERYLENCNNFINFIESGGVSIDDTDYTIQEQELLSKLSSLGAEVRHDNKSVVYNHDSPSCRHCRTGQGSETYILTLACNRDCFFCANKNQEDYENGTATIYNIYDKYKNDLNRYGHMRSAAITGGEPLLYPEKCAEFIRKVKKTDKNVETRIYTNGDLITEDILKLLKDAGLDEIRFGLKTDENGDIPEKLINNLSLANKYIKRTMVEMPVVPGQLEKMKELMLKLDEIGIYGINILEFLYPFVHSDEYAKLGYKIPRYPYRVLFSYDYAGGVPVAGSSVECLKLTLFCVEKKLKMGVHYCSLENKLTSQIYQANHKVKLSGVEYFSEKDFFIKTVKGYGKDSEEIKNILDKSGVSHYAYDKTRQIIEFSPKDVHFLKDNNMELGLTYMAVDYDENYGRNVLRELKIDKISPDSFDIAEI